MLRRVLLAFELVLLIGIGAAGCKQGIGERCEIDSDCASGMCNVSGAGLGGTCQGADMPPTVNDAGVGGDASPDEGTGDADQEAGAPPDAAAEVGTTPDADGDLGEAGTAPDADDDGGLVDAPVLPNG
jgi:hypothetical protein